MQIRRLWEKYGDYVAVGLTIVCNIILISLLFDFYYDINDDVMIKDIIAGVYSGTPEGHNMQMLYVLSGFLSLCYRLYRDVPWYGIFLCLCQFGSLYLVGVRLLGLCESRIWKRIWLLMLTLFIWSVLLIHLVTVQYTVTSGIMAAAAIFLFMTTEKELSIKSFFCRNIPSILLIILAFQLRTEMLLLLFPLVGLAGFFRWLEEEKFWQKENYLKYGLVIGTILLGMGFSLLIDVIAYGSTEWRSFRSIFNDRTRVYDYHLDILTDGTHTEQLAKIGFSKADQELLANYNFGLNESIDEEAFADLAEYADTYAAQNTDIKALLSEQIGRYRYRILHLQDGYYGILMLFGYGIVFGIGIFAAVIYRGKGRIRFLTEAFLLMAVRTALWLFILMRRREPPRITHPLYLAEFAVLMGIVFLWFSGMRHGGIQFHKTGEAERILGKIKAAYIVVGIWGLTMLGMAPDSIKSVRQDILRRQQVNANALAIAEYCREHADNFYFEDVYSTVEFSQEMFRNVDNRLTNYDIMGGWICKSPIYREKLERFGIATMEEGLLGNSNVYLIMETGTPESSTEWLQEYYAEKGTDIRVEQVDSVGDGYAVYRIIK